MTNPSEAPTDEPLQPEPLDVYMQACEERWATDPDYRRRLQLELFDTDARIAHQQTENLARFPRARRTPHHPYERTARHG